MIDQRHECSLELSELLVSPFGLLNEGIAYRSSRVRVETEQDTRLLASTLDHPEMRVDLRGADHRSMVSLGMELVWSSPGQLQKFNLRIRPPAVNRYYARAAFK